MWFLRKLFWNCLAVLKFRSSKPDIIPVPKNIGRPIKGVSLSSHYPGIPIPNIIVADHIPEDESFKLKVFFYDFQVAMYRLFSPMQPGLPSIDEDDENALAVAYSSAHRRCFPAPMLPDEYKSPVDLGRIAVASPYAAYLEKCGDGEYQWDFQNLAKYQHHEGLVSLGVRVRFRVIQPEHRLDAYLIESELGTFKPGDANWGLAQKLALCSMTTHASLVRHFNWTHLAAGSAFAIATRNCLNSNHHLRRLLWPHMFATHFSNHITVIGQMVKGGDFDSIFSFTHEGMCKLFEETYEDFDIGILDPGADAERRGTKNAGFDTPALENREAHFDVMHAHALRYLQLYYDSDECLAKDLEFVEWVDALEKLVPNGIRKLLGEKISILGAARLIAGFIYLGAVEHEIVGTGLWNYQMWNQVQPVRIYKNGRQVPLDVYQRLVNANLNLNISRTQLLQDFSYLGLDHKGKDEFRRFRQELLDLQSNLDKMPFAYWKIYPSILEANINA